MVSITFLMNLANRLNQPVFHCAPAKAYEALMDKLKEIGLSALAERLTNPRVPFAMLSGQKNRYKIKLRSAGCRRSRKTRINYADKRLTQLRCVYPHPKGGRGAKVLK